MINTILRALFKWKTIRAIKEAAWAAEINAAYNQKTMTELQEMREKQVKEIEIAEAKISDFEGSHKREDRDEMKEHIKTRDAHKNGLRLIEDKVLNVQHNIDEQKMRADEQWTRAKFVSEKF